MEDNGHGDRQGKRNTYKGREEDSAREGKEREGCGSVGRMFGYKMEGRFLWGLWKETNRPPRTQLTHKPP